MKQFYSILFLVLSISVLPTSCEKPYTADLSIREKPPITLDSMLQCHGHNNWDSATIRNTLLGKWQWEYIRCYWTPESANGTDYKNLTIEFKQNDSVEVKVNNQILQISSWKIAQLNDGFSKLVVNPMVVQLPGKILFCGGHVLFYDSYTDGCDNYFKKIN